MFLTLKRSWAYGVSFYAKKVDGKDRLLIVINESGFKKRKERNLGQEFLDLNSRPILADAEHLTGLPGRHTHAILLAISNYTGPIETFLNITERPHRLANEPSAQNIEIGWQPSSTAKVGYAMNLSKRTFELVRNLAVSVLLADVLTIIFAGPEYSLHLIEILKEAGHQIYYDQLQDLKNQIGWPLGIAVGGAFWAFRKIKSLNIVYPPIVMHKERATLLSDNIENFWHQNPEVDQAVLVMGGFSSQALGWKLVNESGYQNIAPDELFDIVHQGTDQKPNGWFYKLSRKAMALNHKWTVFSHKIFGPPDE